MPKTKTHTEFVDQANQIHSNEYEYLTPYVNATSKVKIKHKNCGFIFLQRPNNHIIHKQGCPKCGVIKRTLSLRKSHDDFVNQANQIHSNEYEYISEYINDASKIHIKHNECGHMFFQRVSSHLAGQGCPECASSKGEILIKHWLEKNKINFVYQHKFDECVNPNTNRKLKFDFYLPEYKTAIEFDGLQHYKPVRFVGMTQLQADKAFVLCKELDKIKNKFCRDNGIELVRIGFVRNSIDADKIDEILLDIIT